MDNRVFLNIDTRCGLISIPFKGLKELDSFTIGFKNQDELINTINHILGINILVDDVWDICIHSNRYTKKEGLNFIKYSDDDFVNESLVEAFISYLKNDRNRIRKCDVKYVSTAGMSRFMDGGLISDFEIGLAVRAYFGNDYKKYRDVYFMICDEEKIEKKKVIKNKPNVKRTKLSKLESRRNDYVQNLIELASRGDEELEMVMDELSKLDLEELKESLGMVDRGVIDGITKDVDTKVDIDDIVAFEHLTDFRDNELENIKVTYNSSYGRKR